MHTAAREAIISHVMDTGAQDGINQKALRLALLTREALEQENGIIKRICEQFARRLEHALHKKNQDMRINDYLLLAKDARTLRKEAGISWSHPTWPSEQVIALEFDLADFRKPFIGFRSPESGPISQQRRSALESSLGALLDKQRTHSWIRWQYVDVNWTRDESILQLAGAAKFQGVDFHLWVAERFASILEVISRNLGDSTQ